MNDISLIEVIRKVPEDKLYKNPKIKENLSETKTHVLSKLDIILDKRKKDMLTLSQDGKFPRKI